MFKKAVPVWIAGEEETRNSQLVLKTESETLAGCELWITASSFYRLSVNGEFVAFGPARTAGGYGRVDRIDLSGCPARKEKQEILIEVVGYHCHSLSTVLQKNYVAAEIRRGEQVVAATGEDFEAYRSCRRVQKVERYSMQRHFGEIWDERESEPFSDKYRAELAAVENGVRFIPRGVPAPDYTPMVLDSAKSCGSFVFDETLPYRRRRYSESLETETIWDEFSEDEIEYFPYRWIQRHRLQRTAASQKLPILLRENEYAVFDFQQLQAGFLEWELDSLEESEVVIGYSEMCFDCEFEFTDMKAHNVLQVILPEGAKKRGSSFEPYTFRFCIVMVKRGSVRLEQFGMRSFVRDMSDARRHEFKDKELAPIYEAALRTFAHNAVDLFTDCPSRERAGWLCDSFFTGRAEYFLFGKTPIEDIFLENYRLYENNGDLPKGVLPMCYPADVKKNSKVFIPQWDMWYVIEVAEYLTERNPSVDPELFRESVMGVLGFLEKYENGDGLLQQLPSWNFIEWSTANEWGWDVNYPTNFLYAQVLQSAGELYGIHELLEKAERVRRTAREKSFDGEYFVDHAVFNDRGELSDLTDTSEAGQYYAILFGGVDMDAPEYKGLKENVLTGFKNRRDDGRVFVPVNAFIGFYLRICVLMKLGEKEVLRQDLKEFFGGMVSSTGTLWEYKERKGSYDHGFASLAAMAAVYADL